MSKNICSLCLLFIINTACAFAEIREIHSLEEISLKEFSKQTLVMLDIDDVLIYPKDALLQNWRSGWHPEEVRAWTAEEDTTAWLQAQFQLMDPYSLQFLKLLSQNGIPTIGFTSFVMEKPDLVKSIPQWRSAQLKKLGLYFEIGKEVVFPAPEGFIPPSFEKGVLYCGDFSKYKKDKGAVLSLYLDWLAWTPEKAVLVDDGMKNLEGVEKELSKRGIPFLGFLYIPKALDPIDEDVAELQYKTIIEQRRWLSDEEAKERLIKS